MTQVLFVEQMQRLNGLKFAPADYGTHWEALHDLPDDVLSAAVTRSQRTRVEFPTPVELRQDADLVVRIPQEERNDPDRMTPLAEPWTVRYPEGGATIVVKHRWRYDCDECSDSGWLSVWCGPFTSTRKPWWEPRTCERRGAHDSHEWVLACPCSKTNPTLERRRETQRKYAEKPGKA